MAKHHISIPFLLMLFLVATGCDINQADQAPAGMPNKATRVTTVELVPQTVDIERELTGRTTAYRWAEVRPEVGGILKERCFTEGALVKEGDVLYRIEPDTYIAALNKARADLASAQANLNVTRLRERRTAGMVRSKSVSQQDYDDVKAALQEAEAAVKSYKAAMETAEINYRRTEVRAPISGHIGISNFTAGALLTASQATPLTTIYQTSPMYVELSQSSDDLYALKKQLRANSNGSVVDFSNIKATLTMADGSHYEEVGFLNFTGVDVDQTTNTIMLRAEFPNAKGELLPGLFVRANVVMGEDPHALLVPQKAVLRDLQGRPYLYVLKDGKADRHFITVSRSIGNDWYVTAGVKAGDKVILDGVNNVRSGMSVEEVSNLEETAEHQAGAPAEQRAGGDA